MTSSHLRHALKPLYRQETTICQDPGVSYIPGITDYSYNILQSFSADGIETINPTRSGGVWTLREFNMCVMISSAS